MIPDLENVTAELSDIADQLDQMGSVFSSDWPVKMSDRVRAVALQLIDGSHGAG